MNDRTGYIGGADIACILGISPWKSAVDLWLDKLGLQVEETDPVKLENFKRGKRLEPYVCDMIESEYGMKIVARNVRSADPVVPHFKAGIDAENDRAENIEIKTIHPFKLGDWGAVDTDELPIHIVAQTQWGLGIRRRDVCHVFALFGFDLRHYIVNRDEETIVAMRAKAQEFWDLYVLPKLRPPLDYSSPRIAETLKRLYPGTDGTTRDANDDDIHWRSVLAKAEEKRDGYQGVIDGARAHLLERMGTAAFLRFNDGKAFRRKETTRKGYTVEPVTYVDFRLVNLKDTA